MQIQFIGSVETSDQNPHAETDRARHLSSLGFNGARIAGSSNNEWLVAMADDLLADFSLAQITLSHRPESSPIEAADRMAALDQALNGRLDVSISAVPHPTERQGFVHELDQSRIDEYLVLLKRLWLNDKPFDYEGAFYRVQQGLIASRPFNGGTIPLVLGGRSATAMRVAAKHADRYDLAGLDLESASHAIDRMETMAAPFGRAGKIEYTLDIEPNVRTTGGELFRSEAAASDAAAPLSGTPEQVALSLLKYVDLGVSRFTVHEAVDVDRVEAFAELVMPLVRRGVAHRAEREAIGEKIMMANGGESRQAARAWTGFSSFNA